MLSEYLREAMERATYKMLENGSYYGEIPACPGVWADAPTLEACRRELQEVLEDWVLLRLRANKHLPVIRGIDLNAVGAAVEDA